MLSSFVVVDLVVHVVLVVRPLVALLARKWGKRMMDLQQLLRMRLSALGPVSHGQVAALMAPAVPENW